MNALAPAHELVAILASAAAALDADDSDTAAVEMAAAADLCRRLQSAGISLPASELGRVAALYEQCGIALARIGHELNAAGFRDEQQRRGLEAYHGHSGRGR